MLQNSAAAATEADEERDTARDELRQTRRNEPRQSVEESGEGDKKEGDGDAHDCDENRQTGRDSRHAHRPTDGVLPGRLSHEPITDKSNAQQDRYPVKRAPIAGAGDWQLQPRPERARPGPQAVEQSESETALDPLQNARAGNHARRQRRNERRGAEYQPERRQWGEPFQ